MFGGGGGAAVEAGSRTCSARSAAAAGRGPGAAAAAAEAVEVEARVPFLTAAARRHDRPARRRPGHRREGPARVRGRQEAAGRAGRGSSGEDIVVKVPRRPAPLLPPRGQRRADRRADQHRRRRSWAARSRCRRSAGKRVTVKVPPGTSSGSRIRLPGMGIAGGDQYLVMKVVVPKGKPDDKTRKLIEEYAEAPSRTTCASTCRGGDWANGPASAGRGNPGPPDASNRLGGPRSSAR